MSQLIFQRSLLKDEQRLKDFFYKEGLWDQTCKKVNIRRSEISSSCIKKTIDCIKAPINLSAVFFLYTMSLCFKLIKNRNFSIRCIIWEKYLFSKFINIFHSENTLVPTVNMPSPMHDDIYLQEKISIFELSKSLQEAHLTFVKQQKAKCLLRIERLKNRAIEDLKQQFNMRKKDIDALDHIDLKNRSLEKLSEQKDLKLKQIMDLYEDKLKELEQDSKLENLYIEFDRTEGMCSGASEWFAFLYFKSLNSYHDFDPISHLKLIAEKFENGVPRQASLLQILHCAKQILKLDCKDFPLCTEKIDDQNSSIDNVLKELYCHFKKIKSGIYKISFPMHAMVLIKQNDLMLIFDPAKGLINLENQNQFIKFFQVYFYWYKIDVKSIRCSKFDLKNDTDYMEQVS